MGVSSRGRAGNLDFASDEFHEKTFTIVGPSTRFRLFSLKGGREPAWIYLRKRICEASRE